jgi:predicted transcriptional regulator
MTAHKKTGTMSIRIDDEVKEMLRELAAADHRTITSWLEHTIRVEHEKLKEKRRG